MTEVTCSTKVWKRLTSIYAARENSKARLADLVKTRKSLDAELDELGAGKTAKHMQKSREYVVCLRAIDYERARVQELADLQGSTIKSGIEGKFDFDEDDFDAPDTASESDYFLHHREPPPAEDPNQQKLPVGGPSAKEPPKKPALEPAPVHQGVDMHLAASVNELDMPELNKGRLLNAGINTVADAIKLFEDDTKHPGTVLNCGEKIVAAIKKAVAAYRDKHRTAMVEKFTTGTGEN